MKRSFSLAHLISAAFFAATAAILATVIAVEHFGFLAPKGNAAYNAKVNEILSLVDKYYVGEVDETVMADYIASGCISGLEDRYADYYSADDAKTRFDSLYGYFTGIGVQISLHPDNNTMYVTEVHSGSPAEVSGIRSGDEITSVDGLDVVKDGYDKVLQYIKTRPIDSELIVKLTRNSKTVIVPVTLKQFNSQTVFGKLIGDTGYIYITEFNDLGPAQFKTTVNDLIAKGAKELVFDLRNNGGGTLTSVVEMLDFLLPEGLIIEIRYKDAKYNERYTSDKSEINLPMAVLTNENTASASEIFAQSLKDYKKAVTIGCTTFGKGVVQRTFTLSDGSLAVFTIAKYYSMSGHCPDGVGVSADIATEWSEEELKYRIVNGIEADKDFLAACRYFDGQ